MQLAAEYWSIVIGYKETKHDEWGYTGKIKFKKKKNSIISGKASNNWKKQWSFRMKNWTS